MSAPNGNPTTKNGNQPVPQIQMVITLDQVTGQVNVQGPVNNLILCYGLLEAAKDSCREYIKQQSAGKRIIEPQFGLPRN